MITASLSLSILLAVDGFLSEAHVGIFLDENAGKSCPHHVLLMMDFFSCNNEGMQCCAVLQVHSEWRYRKGPWCRLGSVWLLGTFGL